MTGNTPARRNLAGPIEMVQGYQSEFAQVLPTHVKPETFTRLAVGALRRDPNLLQAATANPSSLMHALLEAARLGLEPGTAEYYLTPRLGGKDPGVLGITGYQGEIELIYRAGAVVSVKAEVVCSGDTFRYDPNEATPFHQVDWFGRRGDVLGAYAYAEMVGGGTSKVVIIGPEDIDRARDASASAKSAHSPWKTDFAAMVLKTAVHRLAKWVPTSAEYRREQLRSVAQVAMEMHDLPPGGVVEERPAWVDPDGVVVEPATTSESPS